MIAMLQAIPVIDIADYLAGRDGALEATAARVRDALTTVGFFVLTGHDVPYGMIERTFAEAARFHDLPIDKKLGLKLNEHVNGYMAMSRYAVWTSDVNNNDKPDLNEAFFIKRERPPDDPLRLSGRRFVGPNLWPDKADLPGFRTRVLEYADRMDGLARRFLPAVAVALDLEPTWFDAAFTDSQFTLRLSHYPPVAAQDNQFGVAQPADSSFMIFVAQSEVRGLELRMSSGYCIEVPYIRDCFAVNSGDIMQRWSNGPFKSTPLRVLPPVDCLRYAIPYFLGPRFD